MYDIHTHTYTDALNANSHVCYLLLELIIITHLPTAK